MTVLWIEGHAMPNPAYRGYTTRKEELVKAKRNVSNVIGEIIDQALSDAEAGELIKHHIAWKWTIDVQWKGLSYAEKNLIMSLTGDEKFRVDFIDLDTDTKMTNFSMYRGTGQTVTGYGKLTKANEEGTIQRFQYYDISMSLIQL